MREALWLAQRFKKWGHTISESSLGTLHIKRTEQPIYYSYEPVKSSHLFRTMLFCIDDFPLPYKENKEAQRDCRMHFHHFSEPQFFSHQLKKTSSWSRTPGLCHAWAMLSGHSHRILWILFSEYHSPLHLLRRSPVQANFLRLKMFILLKLAF